MAKRKVTMKGGGKLKGIDPLKKNERQFGKTLSRMVELMARIYRNQVIEELNKGTIKKFSDASHDGNEVTKRAIVVERTESKTVKVAEFYDSTGYVYDEDELRSLPDHVYEKMKLRSRSVDKEIKVKRTSIEYQYFTDKQYLNHLGFNDAQVGNYANVFLGISKKVTKKLKKRFSDERIEKLVKQQLADVNRHNAKKFYNRAEDAIGISAKELYNTEGLTFQINAMELETAQWAKKLRDVSLEDFTANSLRVMASGGTIDDVLEQFKDMEEKRARHAEMVARTQVGTFNSLLTKARAENLGITEGIWQTANDERVRPCHRVRDGKRFNLKEGLYSSCDGKTLMPAQDYNCRCTYELVIPEDEE